MTTKRQLALLFVVVPLMLPFVITTSFCLLKLKRVHASPPALSYLTKQSRALTTHSGYSFFHKSREISKLARETIRLVTHSAMNTHGYPIKRWRSEKKDPPPMREDAGALYRKRSAIAQPLKGSGFQEKAPPVLKKIEAPKEGSEDPFLAEWRRQKKFQETAHLSTQFFAFNRMSTQKVFPPSMRSGKDSPLNRPSQGSNQSASSPQPAPDEGRPVHTTVINDYYTALAGRVVGMDQAQGLFVEVTFLDRVGQDGLDFSLSTVLAAQEVRNPSGTFVLHLPAETEGYLIAKAYSGDDVKKTEPVLLGGYAKKPLRVPRSGVSDIEIELIPTEAYLNLHQNQFIGKVLNEYGSDAKPCLEAVDVWVVETRQHVITDQKCLFELRNLERSKTYHLIFEKEGFMTQALPITIDHKKRSRRFHMSPISKFVRGYDIFLGERDPEKAILFATLLKEGKPLSKTIVLTDESENVVYERPRGGFSLPDKGLYATSDNGRMVLWNANAGKRKLNIYRDGKLIAVQSVRLFPGVLHRLDIHVP